MDGDLWKDWILDFAHAVERISPDDVLRDINEDRTISGFPEIKSLDSIGTGIAVQRDHYTVTIKTTLNEMSSTKLVDVITRVVNTATDASKQHAPLLIDELIDRYETDATKFLVAEGDNLTKLVKAIRQSASEGDRAVSSLVDRLVEIAKGWHRIAHPIQISMKARGMTHTLSQELGYEIRGVAVDLFNKHDLLGQARRLTNLLKQVFADVPELAERADEDSTALGDIEISRKQREHLAPVSALCKSVTDAVEVNSALAEEEGHRLLTAAPQLLAKLESSGIPKEIVAEGKDQLAVTLVHCAITFANSTPRWTTCIVFLEGALRLASTDAVKAHVVKNLKIAQKNRRLYGDLEPISSAPSLSSINGIGVTLYGSTDHDAETGSYLSTYYFIFFAIPIFPICRYRVIPTGNGYRFLGKAPLRTFDKWHIAISVIALIWMFSQMK